MIRSMTGFGAATGTAGDMRVTVELRSVNHRFFNPAIKLPGPAARFEGEVREVLREGIARGHVTASVRVDRQTTAPQVVDEARFAAYARLLTELRDRHGLGGAVDVATVLRLPDVLATREEDGEGISASELADVVRTALEALIAMREAEGARLARLLAERLDSVEHGIERLAARAPERLVSERERLRRTLRDLGEGVGVDEQRLVQEMAILAERLDVAEELDRLRAHTRAFRDALDKPDASAVGKRLAFLVQEMSREVNTTGNKARDTAMLHEVVALKEEIERIAEQVENVE